MLWGIRWRWFNFYWMNYLVVLETDFLCGLLVFWNITFSFALIRLRLVNHSRPISLIVSQNIFLKRQGGDSLGCGEWMSARVPCTQADIFIRYFFLFWTKIGNQVSDTHPRSPFLQSSLHFHHFTLSQTPITCQGKKEYSVLAGKHGFWTRQSWV